MSQVKIKMVVETTDPVQMEALAVFFGKLTGKPGVVIEKSEAPVKQEAEKDPVKQEKALAEVAKQDEPATEENPPKADKKSTRGPAKAKDKVAEPAPAEAEASGDENVDIFAVRNLLSKVVESAKSEEVQQVKTKIKEKLKSLGAPNVSLLGAEHYKEMFDFLKEF